MTPNIRQIWALLLANRYFYNNAYKWCWDKDGKMTVFVSLYDIFKCGQQDIRNTIREYERGWLRKLLWLTVTIAGGKWNHHLTNRFSDNMGNKKPNNTHPQTVSTPKHSAQRLLAEATRGIMISFDLLL